MKLHPRAVLLAASFHLVSCGGAENARSCRVDADCGAEGEVLCDQGTCVANGAPSVAVLAPPGSPLTNAVHTFTATVAEPEGESVQVAWSVLATSGGCPGDADPVADAAFAAEVAFWCPGTYEVVATAADPWGHAGTARATVSVAQATGAPDVSGGDPLTVGHRCTGSPLACEAVTEGGSTSLPLGSTGTGGTLAFEWTAVPPPGASGATATFDPSAEVAAPTVTIRSAGGPLAGEWRFRVRVRNELDLVAQDVSIVMVTNREPTIVATGFAADHLFDGSSFTVAARLAPGVSDPDGDAVIPSFTLLESVPNECAFGIAPEEDRSALLTISCADPRQLIGEVERAIRVVADDGNGGRAEATVPLQIGNRPPAISPPPGKSAGHAVGPCDGGAGSCYLATTAPGFSASDPDGDPLSLIDVDALVDPSRSSSYGRSWRDAQDVAQVEFGTPVGLPVEFRSAAGATGFTVRGRVRDAFDAEASTSFPLTVTNRAPSVTIASTTSAGHVYDAVAKRWVASAVVGTVVDPDGDPLQADFTGDAECAGHEMVGSAIRVDCTRAYDTADVTVPPLPGFAGSHAVAFMATDGWASGAGSGSLAVANSAPVGGAFAYATQACRCQCVGGGDLCTEGQYFLGGPVTYPIAYADADGDPALVDGSRICRPGACSRTFTATTSSHQFHHTANEGTATVGIDATVTVTCPLVGDPCSL